MRPDTAREILAVIPARFASSRFPGKMIAPLDGKPLVWHAYERARAARLVTEAVVATDDSRIADALAPYGVPVVMTRDDHASGTDRIAEVAASSQVEVIVNVQGDEPLLDPETIDATIEALFLDPEVVVATARHPIRGPEKIADPNVVKVVCDAQGRALYFSRCPIPNVRDASDRDAGGTHHWQHVGLYAYRREFLLQYSRMPQTPLERLEKLEQLRALENGYNIAVVDTGYEGIGVDTPEDLERVSRIIADQKGKNSV